MVCSKQHMNRGTCPPLLILELIGDFLPFEQLSTQSGGICIKRE